MQLTKVIGFLRTDQKMEVHEACFGSDVEAQLNIGKDELYLRQATGLLSAQKLFIGMGWSVGKIRGTKLTRVGNLRGSCLGIALQHASVSPYMPCG